MASPVNKSAESYESNKKTRDAHINEALPRIMSKMNWGTEELILEHGCKSGSTCFTHFAPMAEKTNSTVYGIDCESMICFAEKNFAHPRVKYVSGTLTLENSPLKGLKFNKIFSVYTLHYIEDYRAELEALYDHLAPGGELFLILVIEAISFDLLQQVKEHPKWKDQSKGHIVVPQWRYEKNPLRTLRDDFEKLGFEIIEFKCDEQSNTFENPGVFANMLFSLNLFATNLPKQEHDELEQFYHKFFEETETKSHKPGPDSANSEYTLTYDALDIFAKKN